MSLSKRGELVIDREAWCAEVHVVSEGWTNFYRFEDKELYLINFTIEWDSADEVDLLEIIESV